MLSIPNREGRRLRPRPCVALATALGCLLQSGALAHMQPVPLDRWGPFLPGSQRCLRAMSHATHACFETVVGIEQRCGDARLRGEACDPEQLEQIEAATQAMLLAAEDACSEGQLTEIGYFGFFDANADLRDACVTQAREAMAAAYAPAVPATLPAAAAACVSASAAYGRKVMWFIVRRQTPVMERLATRLAEGENRAEVARQVELELSATRARWVEGLLAACPDFEAVYGRSAESFLRTLKQRADCVLSKTYVNNALLCLAP